jgi:hypothetical protein
VSAETEVPLLIEIGQILGINPRYLVGQTEVPLLRQIRDAIALLIPATEAGGLPDQAGHAGQFLTTNGTEASWAAVAASPGGSNTQLQYNNGGAFGGITGWSTNGTTALTGGASTTLAVGGATIGSNALAVGGSTLLAGGTVTTAVPLIAGTQTLNNAAVSFTVLDFNITRTALVAGDAFGAGTSMLTIRDGATFLYRFMSNGALVFGTNGGSNLGWSILSNGGGGNRSMVAFDAGTPQFLFNQNGVLAWGSGADVGNDTSLSRASAGVLRFNGAAVVTESVVSDRTLAININGTLYKICLKV